MRADLNLASVNSKKNMHYNLRIRDAKCGYSLNII
jgi:hypothetical protein